VVSSKIVMKHGGKLGLIIKHGDVSNVVVKVTTLSQTWEIILFFFRKIWISSAQKHQIAPVEVSGAADWLDCRSVAFSPQWSQLSQLTTTAAWEPGCLAGHWEFNRNYPQNGRKLEESQAKMLHGDIFCLRFSGKSVHSLHPLSS